AVAAALVITCAAYLRTDGADAVSFSAGFSLRLMFLSKSAISSAGLILSAAILVCISALSRRTRSAIAICYGFECVLVPILSLVSQFGWTLALSSGNWTWLWPWNRLGSYLAPGFTILLLKA